MRTVIGVVFFVLGTLVGIVGSSLLRAESNVEAWDTRIEALMSDVGILVAVEESNLDLIRQITDVSAHANLIALRALDSDRGTEPTLPIDAKVRVLNALYLEWKARPPFFEQDRDAESGEWQGEFKRDAEENLNYLKWAHGQCVEHPEYACKQDRDRRAPGS